MFPSAWLLPTTAWVDAIKASLLVLRRSYLTLTRPQTSCSAFSRCLTSETLPKGCHEVLKVVRASERMSSGMTLLVTTCRCFAIEIARLTFPHTARSNLPLVIWKQRGKKINILRLRRYRSRGYKSPEYKSRATIPEPAPGATIPGPPNTPGTVDGDAVGTCSPVVVGPGTVSAGSKTLKNSQAKLCTARIARMPQR